MTIKIRIIEYSILCLLLVYMPFHLYICELLINKTSIDNIVRDLLILFLFILSLKKKGYTRQSFIVGVGIATIAVYALISYLIYSYPGTFNIARTYIVPILIFYTASKIDLSRDEIINIHRIICIELTMIALYGFFQAFFLGDDFLIKLGYNSKNGFLSSSSFYIGGYFGYQRVVGTFVSPNICGHILAIAFSVILWSNLPMVMNKKFFYIFAVVLGLLGTLSRSAILASIVASTFIWLVKKIKGIHKTIKAKTLMLGVGVCVVGMILVISIDSIMLNHLFSRMLKSSFSGTINMTDSSAMKHYEDLFMPLGTILKHPFGLGFGSNGPMALALNSNANVVESSLYLMLYEVGIIGSIIYFAPYVIVVIDTIKTRQYKYFVPASISVICLIVYLLLPNVQTYEIAFYFYLFLGLYYNKSVKLTYLGKSQEQR